MDRVPQVEIQLGHLCNNRCVFCASGLLTSQKLVGQEDPEPAFGHLADARARGARRVTFVGGEPTLQRSLPALIQRARDLGYEEICLFTNGVRLPQREYVETLLAGGPIELRVSVQGGDQPTHDRVVGRDGAFQRIMTGLEGVKGRGLRITMNACINVLSFPSVEGYVGIAKRYDVRQLHLDQVSPGDVGDRPPGYLGTILARYSEQAPHFSRMLAGFERELGEDFDVNVGNLPYCVMPEWAHKIHHAGDPTLVVPANADGLQAKGRDKYLYRTRTKIKPAGCGSCAFEPVCTGVYGEHAERFGTDDLVPVPLERLARQRNAPLLFTLIARDAIADLKSAGAPPGFELVRADTQLREPEALFVYRTTASRGTPAPGQGREVSLSVRHPRAGGTAIVKGERAALHAGFIDEEAWPLFAWAFERLGERGDVGTLADARRRLAWAAAARETLARMVASLVAADPECEPRTSHDRESATLWVRAGGERTRVKLVTNPAFEKPPVRLVLARAEGREHVMSAVKAALAARA